MNTKTILAVAAFALAGAVPAADTNYTAFAEKVRAVPGAILHLRQDKTLVDAESRAEACRAVDAALAGRRTPIIYACLPEVARGEIEASGDYSPAVAARLLANCGHDRPLGVAEVPTDDPQHVNWLVQHLCTGREFASVVRSRILTACVGAARRAVRSGGESFVGEEGVRRVRERLDALARELNAPRLGNAGAVLAEFGVEVEWDFVRSRMLADTDGICRAVMDGSRRFDEKLQRQLSVALGVEAYNAFVREFNGK